MCHCQVNPVYIGHPWHGRVVYIEDFMTVYMIGFNLLDINVVNDFFSNKY